MCRASFYYSRNSIPLGHYRGLSTNSVTRSQLGWLLPISFVQLVAAITTQLDAPNFFRPTRGRHRNSVGCSQLLSSNSVTPSHSSWLLPTSFVQLEAAIAAQLDAPDIFRPTRGRHRISVGCSRHLSSNSLPRSQLSWLLPTSFVQLGDTIASQLANPNFFRPTHCHDRNSVGYSQLLSSNSVTRPQLSWMLPTPSDQLNAAIILHPIIKACPVLRNTQLVQR